MKQIEAAIGVVVRDGKVLICQRRRNDSFGGYWEFPGGKQEPGETSEQCLIRELQEEVGLQVTHPTPLPSLDHQYPHLHIRLHPFLCFHTTGEAQALECEQCLWVLPQDLARYQFPEANARILPGVIQRLTQEPDIRSGAD